MFVADRYKVVRAESQSETIRSIFCYKLSICTHDLFTHCICLHFDKSAGTRDES